MKTEEQIADLLSPRYKVSEEGFPDMVFKPGEILKLKVHQNGEFWLHYEVNKLFSSPKTINFEESYFKKYPSLFQPLPWYAEREESEMPEYVKRVDGSEVFERVFRYDGSGSIMVKFPKGIYGKGTAGPIGLLNVLPATESEYNQYINSKK